MFCYEIFWKLVYILMFITKFEAELMLNEQSVNLCQFNKLSIYVQINDYIEHTPLMSSVKRV